MTSVVTTFITKYFIDFPASVGRQPAEEVAGVPLFTALGYPEPQIRFHIRRPPSFETAVAFFSTFDLERLKFFDIGCFGDACKTRIPRHLCGPLNIHPCCFKTACDKNNYGQCQAHRKFLASTKKSAHLKRHLEEPGEAAKAVERRLVARVGQPEACPAWLLGRCYVPTCPRAHPDFEIVTPGIRCCSMYQPGETGYNKKKSAKCSYALNMTKCPYLHDIATEDTDTPMMN